jgi:hypothetical protein
MSSIHRFTGDRGLVSVCPSYQPERSAGQGCVVPPKCCAFWLPHAPLRGACGVPDRHFADCSVRDVLDEEGASQRRRS